MSTLAEMRSRTLSLLDDDNTRWSVQEIDGALAVALDSTVIRFSRKSRLLDQIVEADATGGILDLSSYRPVRIQAVSIKLGSSWFRLPELRYSDSTGDITVTYPLRVKLVARPSLPTVAGDTVIYGKDFSIPFPALDHLICNKAAQILSVKDLPEGSVDQGLLSQEQMLWYEVEQGDVSVYDMGGSYVSGRDGFNHYRRHGGGSVSYLYSPHSIQLVDG